MRLDQIMVPREQAVTAAVGDTIQDVLQSMVAKRVGCVVITEGDKAVGIVTNTDMTKAYVNGVPKSTAVSEIMSKQLVTALGTLARDNATALFEKHKIHHVIVTGYTCAQEARLWLTL
eukprot:jgi/Mesvir1/1974/Mv16601-RA.1